MPPIYWVVRKPFSILHNTSSLELEEDTVNRAIISDIGSTVIKHLRTILQNHLVQFIITAAAAPEDNCYRCSASTIM